MLNVRKIILKNSIKFALSILPTNQINEFFETYLQK